jgi:hypothetical protein
LLAFIIRKVVSPLEWALTRRTSKPVISRVQFWRVNATPASSVTFTSEIRQYKVYVFQKSVIIFGTRTEKVTRDKKECICLTWSFLICTARPTHFDILKFDLTV